MEKQNTKAMDFKEIEDLILELQEEQKRCHNFKRPELRHINFMWAFFLFILGTLMVPTLINGILKNIKITPLLLIADSIAIVSTIAIVLFIYKCKKSAINKINKNRDIKIQELDLKIRKLKGLKSEFKKEISCMKVEEEFDQPTTNSNPVKEAKTKDIEPLSKIKPEGFSKIIRRRYTKNPDKTNQNT